MEKIILTTPEELKQLIVDSVQIALKDHDTSRQPDAIAHGGTKYLTVAEAARYLNLAEANRLWFHEQSHDSIYQAGEAASLHKK